MSHRKAAWIFIALGTSAAVDTAHAAPCCGGNAAAPFLISGDEAWLLGAGVVQSDNATRGSLSDITRTFRVDGATLVSDRLQMGISLPLVFRQASFAMGDVRASLGYEALGEYSYSRIRPKIHVYLLQSFPSGRSIYESRVPGAVDVTGRGFYATALGALIAKDFGGWDAFVVPQAQYVAPRTFDAASATLGAGWVGSLAVGAGISPGSGAFRIGARVQRTIESSRDVTSEFGLSQTNPNPTWDLSGEMGYRFGDSWSTFVAYTDSSLSRSMSLGLQYRQER